MNNSAHMPVCGDEPSPLRLRSPDAADHPLFSNRPAGFAGGILNTNILKKIFHFERFWGIERLTTMRLTAFILCVVLLGLQRSGAQVAGDDLGSFTASAKHHTQVTLLLSAADARPGDTIYAGVDMKMEPAWHTYWKNPGDAGQATKIEWQLPPGISAGEIQWPLPSKLPPAEVTTYGYEDEVMLIVPLTIGTSLKTNSNLAMGQVELKAKVSWLECKETCIPADQAVAAKLNIAAETKTSSDAALIQSWKTKLPRTDNIFSFQAWWEKPATGDTRPLIVQGQQMPGDTLLVDKSEFFPAPAPNEQFEIQSATEKVPDAAGFALRKTVKKFSGDWPKEISGLVVVEGNGQRSGFDVTLPVGPTAPAAKTTSTAAPTGEVPVSLWQMLLYAFIGGLILNIMPCVLPVIALKILGFVSEARSDPRRIRNLGFVYALGVIVSFLAFAGIIIGIKAAGHYAGWGIQFGNPIFVVCLTTLVTLVTLNLFGVFEVVLGGGALNAAGELASRSGASGAFFNGLLATILATPCSAPFLTPALGFAFAQSPAVIVAIFLTIGLGLASPYVLLSCNPALLKFLPKPGAWMEKFKIAMGFPMLATVLWLFNVAAADYGSRVFWLGIFLVIVAFAAWVFGEFFQRGRQRRGLALGITIGLLVCGYAYALESHLRWRELATEPDAKTPGAAGDNAWQPWSPEAVDRARAAGKIVLVDFTATWCVTCNAVVKPALESDDVAKKLKDLGVVVLLADYTLTPPAITAEIARYHSAGVPMVLVYPKNSTEPAMVLPQPSPLQLPTSYGRVILEALDRAAK